MMTAYECDRINTVILRVPTNNQIRQIAGLYRAQEWWQAGDDESPQLIPRLIAGSHCFVAALEGEDIVGMGRAISDGVSDAYIQDLTVRSDHRNQGIGRRILQTLLERLNADGLHWIGLIAEPGSYGLYRWAGFREMAACVPMLMNQKP
ncbi:MAG: GNAT family N-acetyltransferase [Deltaproteobacteria bacterium]|nr:GNAT family N-acetyltransferase [Deltaproteobacteria bacterium]